MTRNEILLILETLNAYAPDELLPIVQKWQLGNKSTDGGLIYSMTDKGAFALFANYRLGYFDPRDKFVFIGNDGLLESTDDLSTVIDLYLMADDIYLNNNEKYYFKKLISDKMAG